MRFYFSKNDCFIYFYNLCFGCAGSFFHCVGFSLVALDGGYSLLWSVGFSLQGLLSLQSMDSKHSAFRGRGSQALELGTQVQ